MLTKDDKKYISNEMATQIKDALSKNNDVLVKEMLGLFEATNSAIVKVEDKLGEKFDELSEQVNDINNLVDTHERRIEKLEEKTFPISA